MVRPHAIIGKRDLLSRGEQIPLVKIQTFIVEYGPPDPADVRSNWADVTKAGELLGWEPQFNMRSGIEKLVEWYNAEREWASQILTP